MHAVARACSPEQVDLAAGPRPTTTRWLVRSPVRLRFSPRSSRGSSCENAARLPDAGHSGARCQIVTTGLSKLKNHASWGRLLPLVCCSQA